MRRFFSIIASVIIIVVLATTASCVVSDNTHGTDKPEMPDAKNVEDKYISMQLIPDEKFESGFSLLSQKDHTNGNQVTTLGTHSFYGTAVTSPRWMLAQWDSGPCLVANMVDAGDSEITDGKWRGLKYDKDDNVLSFHLDTSLFYDGKPARQGDYWPHLLIEQSDFDYNNKDSSAQKYYKCSSDKIMLTMDIKLDEYSVTPIDGDWVNAAQFLMYFYVKGINTNDFCWFGVQLFDNRWDTNENYIGYDGGKADASGAMIFSIGSKYVYTNNSNLWLANNPNPGGDWVHIELDIKPFLEQMMVKGSEDGYFKATSLDKLCINGMNLGWETIGTFDATISVRNMALTSYIEK